jgi:hypothetical protein
MADLGWRRNALFDRARHIRGIPHPSSLAQASFATALPIPAASVFKLPEAARVTLLAATSPASRPQQTAQPPRAAEQLVSAVSAKSRTAPGTQAARWKHAARQNPHPAGHAVHGASKRADAKQSGRAVRLASLKKRPSGPKVETAAPTAD